MMTELFYPIDRGPLARPVTALVVSAWIGILQKYKMPPQCFFKQKSGDGIEMCGSVSQCCECGAVGARGGGGACANTE
jgi:hypothetical protein